MQTWNNFLSPKLFRASFLTIKSLTVYLQILDSAGISLLSNAILITHFYLSMHVDNGEWGFSIKNEGKLDMRYDSKAATRTAADLVMTKSCKNG